MKCNLWWNHNRRATAESRQHGLFFTIWQITSLRFKATWPAPTSHLFRVTFRPLEKSKANFTFLRFFPMEKLQVPALKYLVILFNPSSNSSAKAESICHVGRHGSVKKGGILVDHSQTPPQVLCKEHSQHIRFEANQTISGIFYSLQHTSKR